ncbi:MAG: ribonuclease E/G [Pseudomonadota bacterium]
MSKLMLIDAAHPEETRVALLSKGQVEDFDFETAGKEQLRGSIYLAKVTRVEPSLQAAFVEYGGNRHGFLAFSEIHPDYYQLPQEDREAILREAAEAAAADDDDDFGIDDDDDDSDDDDDVDAVSEASSEDDDDDADQDGEPDGAAEADAAGADDEDDDEDGDDEAATADAAESTEDSDGDNAAGDEPSGDGDTDGKKPLRRRGGRGKASAEAAGGRNGGRKTKRRPSRNSFLKKYKIQEVVRRRQVMLVQVVKEERGNKGAALTTYLSLAGRYSVLMPNTPRGGGISRKIANSADRRRLKSVMNELELPPGMGLIVRTAGAKRTKTEIKRDHDYLLKLWDNIRKKTLNSIAPCNIHEEGGLVHRAMRDMFEKEIETVWIGGDAAYREAKDLAKLLMPTQAKKVQQWTDPVPLFVDHGVEAQLDSIFSPTVQLKSGGYLVINQTEALVAIDVNSGRATKARNIEQTALKTNMEAAEEACRQMRLRDLAGLVVIDFIDMDEAKNNRSVENKVKECLKADRARVQFGRISQFGLMEISRQRRRAGILQASSEVCEACNGTGRRRSVESAALQLIRAMESRAADGTLKSLRVEAPTDVALYILNNKRETVLEIENAMGLTIEVASSARMIPGDFLIEVEKDPEAKGRSRQRARQKPQADTSSALDVVDVDDESEDDQAASEADDQSSDAAHAGSDEDDDQPKRRRRRGRRGGRRRRRGRDGDSNDASSDSDGAMKQAEPDAVPEDGGAYLDGVSLSAAEILGDAFETPAAPLETTDPDAPKADEEKPSPKAEKAAGSDAKEPEPKPAPEPEAEPTPAPREEVSPAPAVAAEETPAPEATPEPDPAPEPETVSEPDNRVPASQIVSGGGGAEPDAEKPKPARSKRAGWWNRRGK